MKAYLIEVDSCVSMSEAQITNDEIIFPGLNTEYKTVGFFPIVDGGGYVPLCSKDRVEWVICVRAEKDGKMLDLMEMQKAIEQRAKA